ncbi:MAG TPA: hypothetical protein VMF52_08695 [Steroidobacteraceae bacterium]|nr:hypothetical protein [Steroidobacteraceae bacterium]
MTRVVGVLTIGSGLATQSEYESRLLVRGRRHQRTGRPQGCILFSKDGRAGFQSRIAL